jgi:hypothetical protein
VGEFWYIDKGRLYLQSSARARETFIKRVDHYVERATAYWVTLP